MSEQTDSELVVALENFLADLSDSKKAQDFYSALGKSKLFVLLEYGTPVVKKLEKGSYLQAYTVEPTKKLVTPELSTVELGVKRLAQELKLASAKGVLLDEETHNVKIPAENIFRIHDILQKAKHFKLKRLANEQTLELENALRRLVKQSPEIISAWLVGIQVLAGDDDEYLLVLECDVTATTTRKKEISSKIAESVLAFLPPEKNLLIGTTDELVGQKTKREYAPFYIERNF